MSDAAPAPEALAEGVQARLKEEEISFRRCHFRTEAHSCGLVDLELHWLQKMPNHTCNECWQKGGPSGGESTRTEFVDLTLTRVKDELERQPRKILIPYSVYHEKIDPKLLSRRPLWYAVRHTWKKAGSWLASKASGRGVDPKVRELRAESCRSCPFLSPSKVEDGAYYCGACGCGDKRDALVLRRGGRTKLDYPHLECPLENPGFSNARPV